MSSQDNHSDSKYNLWGGRFEVGNDQLMRMFNESLPIDKRMWEEDLNVSWFNLEKLFYFNAN